MLDEDRLYRAFYGVAALMYFLLTLRQIIAFYVLLKLIIWVPDLYFTNKLLCLFIITAIILMSSACLFMYFACFLLIKTIRRKKNAI